MATEPAQIRPGTNQDDLPDAPETIELGDFNIIIKKKTGTDRSLDASATLLASLFGSPDYCQIGSVPTGTPLAFVNFDGTNYVSAAADDAANLATDAIVNVDGQKLTLQNGGEYSTGASPATVAYDANDNYSAGDIVATPDGTRIRKEDGDDGGTFDADNYLPVIKTPHYLQDDGSIGLTPGTVKQVVFWYLDGGATKLELFPRLPDIRQRLERQHIQSLPSAETIEGRTFNLTDTLGSKFVPKISTIASPVADPAASRNTATDRYGLDIITADGIVLQRVVETGTITPYMFGANPVRIDDSDQHEPFSRMVELAANRDLVEEFGLEFFVAQGYWRIDSTLEMAELEAKWYMEGVFRAPNTVAPFPIISWNSLPRDPEFSDPLHTRTRLNHRISAVRQLKTNGKPMFEDAVGYTKTKYDIADRFRYANEPDVAILINQSWNEQLEIGIAGWTLIGVHIRSSDVHLKSAPSQSSTITMESKKISRITRLWTLTNGGIADRWNAGQEAGIGGVSGSSSETVAGISRHSVVITSMNGEYKGAWAPTTEYFPAHYVSESGSLYRRLHTPFTSGASFDATEWELVSDSFQGDWSLASAYVFDDTVHHEGDLFNRRAFQSNASFSSGNWTLLAAVFRGAWQSSTAYNAGESAEFSGDLYEANSAFTSGASFNAANWTIVPGTYTGDWLPSNAYNDFDNINRGGKTYTKKRFEPGTSGQWGKLNGTIRAPNTIKFLSGFLDQYKAFNSPAEESSAFVLDRASTISADGVIRIEDNTGGTSMRPVIMPDSSPKGGSGNELHFVRSTEMLDSEDNLRDNFMTCTEGRETVDSLSQFQVAATFRANECWWEGDDVVMPRPAVAQRGNFRDVFDVGKNNEGYIYELSEDGKLTSNGAEYIGIALKIEELRPFNKFLIETDVNVRWSLSGIDSSGNYLTLGAEGSRFVEMHDPILSLNESVGNIRRATAGTAASKQESFSLKSSGFDISEVIVWIHGFTDLSEFKVSVRNARVSHSKRNVRERFQVTEEPKNGYWRAGTLITSPSTLWRISATGYLTSGAWDVADTPAIGQLYTNAGNVYRATTVTQNSTPAPTHTTGTVNGYEFVSNEIATIVTV